MNEDIPFPLEIKIAIEQLKRNGFSSKDFVNTLPKDLV
jgi:hypothetical protein